MNPQHLNTLEQRAYRAIVDDGLLDILLGLFVLTFGIIFATNIPYIDIVLIVLAYPIWKSLRRSFVEPRVGYVRLQSSRRATIKKSRAAVIIVFLLIVFGVDALFELDHAWVATLREMRSIMVGLALGIPVILASVLLQLRRWWLYALLVIAAASIEYVTGASYGTGWFVSGSVIIAIGLYVFSSFLRRHPLPSDPPYAET